MSGIKCTGESSHGIVYSIKPPVEVSGRKVAFVVLIQRGHNSMVVGSEEGGEVLFSELGDLADKVPLVGALRRANEALQKVWDEMVAAGKLEG